VDVDFQEGADDVSKHSPPYPNAATDPFNKLPGMNRPPMTAEADLLPCPGCNGPNTRVIGGPGTRGGPKYWAGCDQCRWRTWGNTEAEAIAAWNRRAQAAEIKALRAEVERANSWNERVSVCRDHVADIVDGPCVICALDAAKARAERLEEALRGWWEAHRPVGWTEDQHRSCPHVNLATDAEKALATALLRDQEEGK
jgi:hypothetical protein